MRIAFVTPEYITEETFDGGLSNYLYRVSIALKNMGHEPVIFVSSNKNNEVIRHKNIEVHRILIDHKNTVQFDDHDFNNAIYWIYQSKLLNKKVEETHKLNPFDIIQYSSWMSTAFFRIQYIPSVVRISSYQKLWDEAYKETTSSTGQKIKQDLEICSLKLADSIIGPCKNILYHLEKDYNIKGELIESPFIQTVNLNEYDNSIYKKYLENKKYILFFGTIGILKGCLLISEIIKNLLNEYQDIYFVFVGKNTEYNNKLFIDYIKDKAEKYHNRIIHINKIPHSQLYPIIKQSDFVVLPSLVDNFPNTCIESMAHKKIVIGTTETGFEQLITNNVNGFLINKEKPEELLNQIKKVINLNNSAKTEIEEKAYEKILTLAPEKVVNNLIDYYNYTIGNFKTNNKKINFLITFYNNLLSNFIEERYKTHKVYANMHQDNENLKALYEEKEKSCNQIYQDNEKLKALYEEKEKSCNQIYQDNEKLKALYEEKEKSCNQIYKDNEKLKALYEEKEKDYKYLEENMLQIKALYEQKEKDYKYLEENMLQIKALYEQKEKDYKYLEENMLQIKALYQEKEKDYKYLEENMLQIKALYQEKEKDYKYLEENMLQIKALYQEKENDYQLIKNDFEQLQNSKAVIFTRKIKQSPFLMSIISFIYNNLKMIIKF